jgi:molecular chaperone DnaJ
MSKDYYKILGVEKGATKDEIKKAFREKAHVFHPDKKDGDETKFKEINEAYQVLHDDQKRQQYDQFGSSFDQQGGFGGGMNWSDFMNQARGGGFSAGGDFGDLNDILGDLFGGGFGGGRRKTNNRGHDIEVDLSLSFEEAVFGVEKTIELYKLEICDKCNGNGAEPGTKISECKNCGGQGKVQKVQRTILGNMQTVVVCPDCVGEGKKHEKDCVKCSGQGRHKEKKQVQVKVPAGIDNGMTLRMQNEGEAGIKGSKSGDLFIHIHVKPSEEFKRQGNSIITHQEISFSQAALGDKVAIKTIDGEVSLKIPAGTQSGKVFKLKGKGVPSFQGYGKGDHHVEVIVKTPEKLSKDQKKILEELGKEGI